MISPFILITLIAGTVVSSDNKKYEDPMGSLDHINAERILDLNTQKVDYNCIPCNVISQRYYDFVRHRHNDTCKFRPQMRMILTSSFNCGFCGTKCNDLDALKAHQNNIKNMNSRIEPMSQQELETLENNAKIMLDKLQDLRARKG